MWAGIWTHHLSDFFWVCCCALHRHAMFVVSSTYLRDFWVGNAQHLHSLGAMTLNQFDEDPLENGEQEMAGDQKIIGLFKQVITRVTQNPKRPIEIGLRLNCGELKKNAFPLHWVSELGICKSKVSGVPLYYWDENLLLTTIECSTPWATTTASHYKARLCIASSSWYHWIAPLVKQLLYTVLN